jgi:hypothetical protein
MDDLTKIIEEVKKTTASAQNTPGNPSGAQPGPITIRLGNEEFKFSGPDELSLAMTNLVAAYQAQMAELQKKMAEASQASEIKEPDRGSYVTSDEPGPFDKDKYIQLLREDPVAAADYVDSYRLFGGYIERPAELLRNALAKVAEQDRILAAYQFRSAHPEFPGGNEAVATLEKIRQENNLPFTASGLEAAYGIAQARGLLPGPQHYQQFLQAQQAQQVEQLKSFVTRDLRPQGPPSLGRASADVPPDIAAVADSLTPEQIEQIFARLNQASKT